MLKRSRNTTAASVPSISPWMWMSIKAISGGFPSACSMASAALETAAVTQYPRSVNVSRRSSAVTRSSSTIKMRAGMLFPGHPFRTSTRHGYTCDSSASVFSSGEMSRGQRLCRPLQPCVAVVCFTTFQCRSFETLSKPALPMKPAFIHGQETHWRSGITSTLFFKCGT